MQARHDAVPGHLGHHRSGGDTGGDLVPLPHRQRGSRQTADREAVGEHIPRAAGNAGQGPAHAGDVAYVQPKAVDLGRRDHDRVPGQRMSHNFTVDLFPHGRGQRLRVRQPRHRRIRSGEHHGRDHQGTRARAPARPRRYRPPAQGQREPGRARSRTDRLRGAACIQAVAARTDGRQAGTAISMVRHHAVRKRPRMDPRSSWPAPATSPACLLRQCQSAMPAAGIARGSIAVGAPDRAGRRVPCGHPAFQARHDTWQGTSDRRSSPGSAHQALCGWCSRLDCRGRSGSATGSAAVA